ncbi:uncharacterized protein LOC144704962 [Wolffia australiana]
MARYRRGPHLLADDHRARLLGGHVSSGSDHGDDLTGVVDGIFFSDEEEDANTEDNGDESLEFSLPPAEAAERAVMGQLREAGYNAGLCKARWEVRGGGGGSYEYVDVVRDDTRQRYIVEVEFRGQFEIARPTAEYERVAAQLPRVYVERPEELRRLLHLLADAAKQSLQLRELHVPPWRKRHYMQAKWLGPYRRTTNPVSSAAAAAPPPPLVCAAGRDVKCRMTGFYWAAPPSGAILDNCHFGYVSGV